MGSTYLKGAVLGLALGLLSACSSLQAQQNLPLLTPNDHAPYRITTIPDDTSPELFMALAFSGGGKRSSAFGYGVLTGLREIANVHRGEFRMTANQNLVIAGVPASERERIDALVKAHGLDAGERLGTALQRAAVACVAAFTASGTAFTMRDTWLTVCESAAPSIWAALSGAASPLLPRAAAPALRGALGSRSRIAWASATPPCPSSPA